jgi:hypothetical protein
MNQQNSGLQRNMPVEDPFNLRRELALFRSCPLQPLLEQIRRDATDHFFYDEAIRCVTTYWLYYQALERWFAYLSLAIRLRYPSRLAPTSRTQEIKKRHRAAAAHAELDFFTCVIFCADTL